MVELITVIVLLGILAAVIMPRLLGSTGVAGPAFRSEIVSALRYAQKAAVSHRRLVCVAVGASSVTLNIADTNPAAGCNAALASPDGAPYASGNTNVTASSATLYFQPTGEISNDAAGAQRASGQIAVSGEAPVRYEGATGYVE